MALEHTQTSQRVFEVKGSVEITKPVPRTKRVEKELVSFRGFMAGDSDEKRRANFKYYRTFGVPKDERMAMKAVEIEGRVRLIDYEIIQELGLHNGN